MVRAAGVDSRRLRAHMGKRLLPGNSQNYDIVDECLHPDGGPSALYTWSDRRPQHYVEGYSDADSWASRSEVSFDYYPPSRSGRSDISASRFEMSRRYSGGRAVQPPPKHLETRQKFADYKVGVIRGPLADQGGRKTKRMFAGQFDTIDVMDPSRVQSIQPSSARPSDRGSRTSGDGRSMRSGGTRAPRALESARQSQPSQSYQGSETRGSQSARGEWSSRFPGSGRSGQASSRTVATLTPGHGLDGVSSALRATYGAQGPHNQREAKGQSSPGGVSASGRSEFLRPAAGLPKERIKSENL